MALPAGVGTFTYNGFTFNSSTRSQVRGKPVYDAADRTVVAMDFSITAVTVLQADAGVDAQSLDAVQRLSKAGQQLVYTSNGFVGLSINVGNAKDVMWGPKPRVLDMRPIGSSQAWELTWTCDVCIPMCGSAAYSGQPMAFNFEVQYSIDADGYTTRTITGYIEIPLTRLAGGNQVTDNADNYWERVIPDIPPGYARKDRTRTLSNDKRKLDFTIVDEQIPGGGFPPGCTDFEGSHGIASESMASIKFVSTLSASYVVAPGQPRAMAANHFWQLAQDRSSQAAGGGGLGGFGGSGSALGGIGRALNSRIFTSFTAEEGLGRNRRVRFTISWTYLSTIADCIADGGLYRQVPGADWGKWLASGGVRDAQGARGLSGMMFASGDDSIVDLCQPVKSTNTLSSSSRLSSGPGNALGSLFANLGPGANQLDSAKTWLVFRCWLTVRGEGNVVRLKALPSAEPLNTSMGNVNALDGSGISNIAATIGAGAGGGVGAVGWATVQGDGSFLNTVGNNVADVLQIRSSPSYRVTLHGYAARAGYQIPLPQLQLVGGVVPEPLDHIAEGNQLVGVWSGVPIYWRAWQLMYDLDEAPDNATIGVPGNPSLQLS